MLGFILVLSAVVCLMVFWGYSLLNKRNNRKAADENVMDTILKQIRLKKTATDKIALIEFLNLPPKLCTKIINNMLTKDLIRIDDNKVSISEFGKHYYDKFIKGK